MISSILSWTKLLGSLLIGVAISCTQGIRESSPPPNILFILVDDLGKEWISCYGAQEIETPNIDALARSGKIFHNVYSMPQCTPTRVTLLTGQYPFRHGWVNHWDVPRWGGGAHYDERKNPTLTQHLKDAGYKMCIAGKWQIDDFRVEPDALTKIGFDSYCMWTGYETGIPASAERYQHPFLYQDGQRKSRVNEFGPDLFRDFIRDFIKKNKSEPMFIYYPMVLTHTPFVDTPDERADNPLGKHKAMVRYTDKIIGQLIATLQREELVQNTLVIFTTDNGTTGRITGKINGVDIKGGKGKTSEPGICAPFIASWPGTIKSGTQSHALIDFTDVLPTFLDLADVKPFSEVTLSDGTKTKIDGKSFKRVLLKDAPRSERTWILSMGGGNFAKLTENGVENQYRFRDRVLRNERFKLVIGSNRQPTHFFDLQVDPQEQRNLLDQVNAREDLRNGYQLLSQQIGSYPSMDADPRYKPNPSREWDVEIAVPSKTWKK